MWQRVPDFFIQSDGTHELGPIQMNEEELPVEEPPQVCLWVLSLSVIFVYSKKSPV